MKVAFLFIVLVVSALVGVMWYAKIQERPPLQERLEDGAAGERWTYDDWDAARERAAREKKPLMVVFRCVP